MAITRITKGVIKPNENYDTHNINSTGIVTSIGLDINGNVDVSGSLSVGGVLTYEDVTSIDSVGLITARNGINVSGGQIAVGSNIKLGNAGIITATGADINGDLDVDGHTNLDNVSIAGVTTFANSIKLNNQQRINFGSSSSSYIYYDSGGTTHFQTKGGNLSIASNIGNTFKHMISAIPNNKVSLYYSGDEKIQTTTKGIQVGTGVTIETNGQAEVAGITTFYKDVHIKSGTNRLYLGTNDRLSLISDPSHSYLRNAGSGSHFQIHSNNFSIRSYDGNGSVTLFYSPVTDGNEGGGPRLYHNHGAGIILERLRTTKSGVNIVGTTTSTQLAVTGVSTFTGNIDANGNLDVDGYVRVPDGNESSGGRVEIGNSRDLRIFHGGHNYYYSSGASHLFTYATQALAQFVPNSSCRLFFSGSKKFETASTGAVVTGILTATSFVGSSGPVGPAPNRNIIENGEFLISQRFENLSSTKANSGNGIVNGVENGVVDRWRMASPSASNIARQRVTDAPDGFAYSFKVTNDSNQFNPSNSNYTFFQQIIEATNVARLAFGTSSAKTVTLSFYVKSSYASSTWAVALGNLTGGVYPGNTTRTHIKSYSISSANTWERKTITFPGDTSGTWAKTGTGGGLAVIWDLGSGGNHQGAATSTWVSSDDYRFSGAKNVADSANGSWQITGIQLEIGDTATEYEHIPIQYELQRCQRYFYCSSTLASGSWNSATTFHCAAHHPVAMRARVSQGLTRSGTLSNINIEPRDQYDITAFSPAAHTHYSPAHAHSVQMMNFTISGSSTTGYSGTVSIDRNNDQFWLSAEL